MSFFKSNKTNTNATVNTNTETEETTNNGSLLKTLAIAGGTAIGIGAAIFGGRKAYKHFHHEEEEVVNSDDDSKEEFEEESEDDNFCEEPVNDKPVENFREVETEVTKKPEPTKAEEAKADVTVDETTAEAEEAKVEEPKKSCWDAFKDPKEAAPAKAEEAKTEETKNETHAEDEKPSATSLVNQLEKEASVFEKEMVLPFEVKTAIEQMDYIMGRIAQCHRTIGDNAHIEVAVRKLQNGVNDFWLGINSKLVMQTNDLESLDVIEDLYGADMDMVDRAYFDMKYINKSDLVLGAKDATVQLFNRLLRVADKMSKKTSTKPVGETKTTENCFNAFKDGHKETNKVEGETKTSTKKVTGETKTVTKSGKKQTKTKASKTVDASATDPLDAINKFAESTCEELVKSSLKSLGSLDYILNVNDQKPCEWLNDVSKYVDSNIGCLLKTNHKTEAYKLINISCRDIENAIFEIKDYMTSVISSASTIEELDDVKESIEALSDSVKLTNIKIGQASLRRIDNVKKSLNNMYAQLKSAGETKTAEPVVDEKQATTKESPSETQIGNSAVISDDGETVTLKASVSEDSVQNVMDVIDIVSKIPNREDPEKNDMPYYIRVIGGRIAGITEPEATFLAYNDKTKSNDFIDACVSLCNMVGNGICNLADQKSDPIGSLGWINRSYDELIASGVIDNTYNPQAMRDALTKARNKATRVLADIAKKSDETQADDNSSNETQVEEPLTYTMSEKIQEAVQQSDETAATTAPESKKTVQMSPEALELMGKLQEAGKLIKAKKWSDASEFYKTQLTPYLAYDGLTDELRDDIMSIKTLATNMMMSQKQLEAKQKAAAAKASKKKSSRRRRH